MKLYMMVTKDKYELPLCVCDNIPELSRYAGIKISTLYCVFAKKKNDENLYKQYVVVEVEDE